MKVGEVKMAHLTGPAESTANRYNRTIEQALKITGFLLCDFVGDGEEACSTCEKPIPMGGNIYYERTCYEVDEGEYHCEGCTIAAPARWEKEAEAWSDYAASLKNAHKRTGLSCGANC